MTRDEILALSAGHTLDSITHKVLGIELYLHPSFPLRFSTDWARINLLLFIVRQSNDQEQEHFGYILDEVRHRMDDDIAWPFAILTLSPEIIAKTFIIWKLEQA